MAKKRDSCKLFKLSSRCNLNAPLTEILDYSIIFSCTFWFIEVFFLVASWLDFFRDAALVQVVGIKWKTVFHSICLNTLELFSFKGEGKGECY